MPVKVIFRCETCGTTPDADTQRGLEGQLRELLFGELSSMPKWGLPS